MRKAGVLQIQDIAGMNLLPVQKEKYIQPMHRHLSQRLLREFLFQVIVRRKTQQILLRKRWEAAEASPG